MSSDGHRWQAAMGALAGALVADAIRAGGTTWCDRGQVAIGHAEGFLRGAPTPIELAPCEAIPIAIGLANGASPLLAEPETVAVIDRVRATFEGAARSGPGDEPPTPTRFLESVRSADNDARAMLSGALIGLRGGIGVVPARLVATTTSPDGRRGRRYLTRLTDRLLGIRRNDWYDPRWKVGPREIVDGVWLSNIHGVDAFVAQHPDGLVLSLCDTEGRIEHHEHQITFHIDDTPKPDANPQLGIVIDDVMSELRLARERGQPVLVHCRHGASRTGLILRLLLVEDLDLDPESALIEAQCRWPQTSTWNTTWTREIERRAESGQVAL